MRNLFVLFFSTCFIAGCDSGSGSDGNGGLAHRNWLCGQSEDACTCDALRDGWEGGRTDEVDRCESFNCCLFSEVATESTTASCECVNSESCQAEAATRSGTRVVEQCPPGAKQTPVACANSGENCRATYLADRGLEGCCEGTLCRENQDGVPVCTAATEEELAADSACRRGLSQTRPDPLEVLDPLVTTTGDLTFDTTTDIRFRVGEGGCLQAVSVALVHAEHTSCALSLMAGPARDPQGDLLITHASVTGTCDAVPPLADALIRPSSVSGTLSVNESVRCAESSTLEQHCIGGVFELRLQAEVVELSGALKTAFTGEPLRLRGVGCGIVSFDKSCPAGS